MKPAGPEGPHNLVYRPPDVQTAATARMLESVAGRGSPGRRPLVTLPLDEEEFSEEALRAVAEGIADRATGRTHTSDEVKRELGI